MFQNGTDVMPEVVVAAGFSALRYYTFAMFLRTQTKYMANSAYSRRNDTNQFQTARSREADPPGPKGACVQLETRGCRQREGPLPLTISMAVT